MAVIDRMRQAQGIAFPFIVLLAATPVAAQGSAKMSLTAQDPASAQPSLPNPMPDLSMPASSEAKSQASGGKTNLSPSKATHHGSHRRIAGNRNVGKPLSRPALANVELVEPLPHPPQPPHVTVPVPAYPLENFVTYFTTPPPPVICMPTRPDRFMPDPHLVNQQPALCTADNP